MTKYCKGCRKYKGTDQFYERGDGGLRATCKECYSRKKRERAAAKRDAEPKARCIHRDGCHRVGRPNRGGWCSMHGARVERTGVPGPVNPKNKVRKRDESYGDPEFKGYGILKCAICGEPLRDHETMRVHMDVLMRRGR